MGIVQEGNAKTTAEALGLAPWGAPMLKAHHRGRLRSGGQRGKKRLRRAYKEECPTASNQPKKIRKVQMW